jgi:hypothetical protein
MTAQSTIESIKGEGTQLLERFKQLIHTGNARRVVIKQGEDIVAEFPLTVGVVGAVLAPMLAAIGMLAALLTHCTIEVERIEKQQPTLVEPNGDRVPILWTGVGIEELLPLLEPKAATLVTNRKAIEDETTA